MKVKEGLKKLAVAIPTITPGTGTFDPKTATVAIINYLLWFLGVIALIFVIWGAVKFITSGGDSTKVKSARDTILYAVIGIIVIALALGIINWAAVTAPAIIR